MLQASFELSLGCAVCGLRRGEQTAQACAIASLRPQSVTDCKFAIAEDTQHLEISLFALFKGTMLNNVFYTTFRLSPAQNGPLCQR
jgi:hypothetical protein